MGFHTKLGVLQHPHPIGAEIESAKSIPSGTRARPGEQKQKRLRRPGVTPGRKTERC